MSWEKEEKEKGMTRREWVQLGVGAATVASLAGLGGLVAGQILPPPYKMTGEVRDTIQYTKFPTPQWWNTKAGTPVKVSDFQQWQGATGVWRGLFQDTTYVPGTGYPCMIIRIKRESQFFTEPPADQVPDDFKRLQASDPAFKLYFDDPALDAANGGTRIVVLFDRCVHLCCYPGWHVVNNPPPGRDYSAYGASPPTYVQFHEDPVYCVCHGSQYDPMRVVVETDQRQLPRSHAEKYELKTIWYWYPLYCLGGISFVAFIVLTITGILLGFFYVPDGRLEISASGDLTNPAWRSMLIIMNDIPFGFIIRGMHHWAAHIMIAAVFLHMCRVYFTGAYKKPRELNWLLGVVLLLLTLAFGYSGYLLPANNLSEGAANIGINMSRASPVIGDQLARLLFGDINTLSGVYILRFYWLHVFILPLVVIGLMVLHMGLVWLQGVAEPH